MWHLVRAAVVSSTFLHTSLATFLDVILLEMDSGVTSILTRISSALSCFCSMASAKAAAAAAAASSAGDGQASSWFILVSALSLPSGTVERVSSRTNGASCWPAVDQLRVAANSLCRSLPNPPQFGDAEPSKRSAADPITLSSNSQRTTASMRRPLFFCTSFRGHLAAGGRRSACGCWRAASK